MTEKSGQLNEAIKVLEELKRLSTVPIVIKSCINTKLLNEAIDTVVAEVEKPKYMADDMEAFAKWCYINAEWIKENEWMLFANDGSGFKVTSTQMRERWEVETGRREEA